MVAFVQSASFANATSGSLGSAVAAGDSVILHVTSFSTSNVTISSNTPTYNGSAVTGAIKMAELQSAFTGGFTTYEAAWLLPNLAGGGTSVSVTVVNGSFNTAVGLQAEEFSGLGSSPALDSTTPNPATNNSNSGTSITSGATGTTASSADLIFGGALDGNAGVSAGGSGFTNTAVMGSATVCGYQIPGSTGTFTYATTGASGGNSLAFCVAITPSGGALTVTTSSLPGGTTGVAYSQTVNATGGTGTGYTWTLNSGSLPAGLSLSSGGVISGTPQTAGTSSFVVKVTDSGSNTALSGTLSITITSNLTVTTSSLPGGVLGSAYSQSVAASGGFGAYTWSLLSGSLPTGLSLSSGGLISGTPSVAGSYSFTVKVTDAGTNTATQALSIVIAAAVFPQALLNTTVQLQLTSDGPWTDITTYAYQRDGTAPPITISRGKPDESANCNPGACAMQWNNRDGRFSPRNPTGPYYGQLGRNTPVRVSVPDNQVYLRIADDTASWIQCPDSAALQITGDMQVAIDCMPDNYMPCTLAAKWGGTGTAWAVILNGDGTVSFWYFDGSVTHTQTSTAPIPLGRVALFVNMDSHSTGLLTFLTAPTMGGTQTQLGAQISVSSTNISAAAGQVVRVGWSGIQPGFQGQVYEFRLQNSAGTVVADPVFTAQTAGATSFNDAQANTWTVNNTAELSSRSYRFHGECTKLPQAWDNSGNDVWTPVGAAGLLQRLQQANSPVLSALRRAIVAIGSAAPVRAYWPMEDLAGSTQIASGLPGGPPMVFGGTPNLAASSSFACSNSLPILNKATFTGPVAAYTSSGSIIVRFLMAVPQAGDTNGTWPVYIATSGTFNWVVGYNSGTGLALGDSGGVASTGLIPPADINGQLIMVSVEITPGGGSVINMGLSVLIVGQSTPITVTTTSTGTIGLATAIIPNAPNSGAVLSTTAVGQFTVQDVLTPLSGMAMPLAAYAGETAGNRFARLCQQYNVAPRIYGFPNVSVAMGAQAIDTLANLLQECEDADRGMIYEPRQALGLGYRTLASLCGQSPQLTLSYSGAQLGDGDGQQPLGVTDDDQFTVNDWIVTNNGGSSVQQQLNDGSAMSVSPPPVGVGDYQSSKTLYLAGDSQLGDAAGWMLRVSSWNEERYPSIPLNLARSELSALFYAIQDMEIGHYVAITGMPAWMPPGSVQQLICGVAEQIAGFHWHLQWQCVPEGPYQVLTWNDSLMGWWDTDGSTLSAGVSSGATSLSVATTNPNSPLWTTSAGDLPFSIIVGGEVMTVTNISGGSSPQTFTVTRSVNGVVKAQASGADVRLYPTPAYALI